MKSLQSISWEIAVWKIVGRGKHIFEEIILKHFDLKYTHFYTMKSVTERQL